MATSKKKKLYYISSDTIKYIEQYKENNDISTASKALETIIKNHKEVSKEKINSAYEILSRDISEQIKSCFSEELKKIKISSRASDKNTQIMLQLLNCILYNNLEWQDILISDCKTPILEKAEKEIENEIMKKHYKKSGSMK
ncbi:hypothetical protein UMC2_34051 [[Clostridium] sordellii]|uniref:hypothetical protein n=1 Tax=Paraclostridium sordellii TaxID=1505 RepID=UPI00054197B1|nr:hypothetical protein [Paeniclostridium sordellii]CEK36535.1 hypothetical protein UMC2_34051 [[Clostridium] sordellii] [Paeniclostridium sordellii]